MAVVIKEVFIMIFIFFMMKCNVSFGSPFETIISQSTFIDKTDFIKALIKYSEVHKKMILTMPRQFGKTTNLDMVKRFLESSHNNTRNDSNFLLFQKRPYNCPLKIMTNQDFVNLHFGRYPIIHIELSIEISDETIDELLTKVAVKYADAMMEYYWLYEEKYLNAAKLSFQDQQTKKCFVFFSSISDSSPIDSSNLCYTQWLFRLGRSLYKYYGVRPILLVDEYDCPISQALLHQMDTKLIIHKLKELWFTALKNSNSPFLLTYMVGITGIYSNIGISALQFDKMPFLTEHEFMKYFGFYEDEMKLLFDRHNIEDEDVKAQITRFFNGYRNDIGLTFYNPFSISSFLSNIFKKVLNPNDVRKVVCRLHYRYPTPYLINQLKSSLDNPAIYHKFVNLTVHRRSIYFKNIDDLSADNLKELSIDSKHSVLRVEKETKSLEDIYFSFLLQTGFLSYDEKHTFFRIPNEHIKYHMDIAFRDHYVANNFESFELGKAVVQDFITITECSEVSEKEVKNVKNSMESLFKHDVLRKKIKNPGIKFKEHNFQDSLFSALSSSKNFYYVHTKEDMRKKDDNEGYHHNGEADISIVSIDCLTVLIVEMKYNVQPTAFQNAIDEQLKRYIPTKDFLNMIQGLHVNLKYILIDVKVKSNNNNETEETCTIDIAYCPAGRFSKEDVVNSSREIKFDESCIILQESKPRIRKH